MLEKILFYIKRLIPRPLFETLQPLYHQALALVGALVYQFPSRSIFAIGITGTKGKSSTAEILNAILEEAGYRTALMSTIRFKRGEQSRPNRFKMTMPGRLFTQKFLRDAARANCDYAILEMTSEGVKQFRHRYIDLDALIFTGIAPEHIEAHGSFENYLAAKLKLRDLLENSLKQKKYAVANVDDEHGELFLEVKSAERLAYRLADARPYATTGRGVLMTVGGESLTSPLLGEFNIMNILAAITFAKTQGVDMPTMKRALEKLDLIRGRAEKIEEGQNFTVVVDYAHTPDSLEKLYDAFRHSHPDTKKICVLGNTGGGRDTWKRPEMGRIADTYCNVIYLTNEDPYDENPRSIALEMAGGIKKHKPFIVMDRREAVRDALSRAHRGDVVLITGKGTDPYIMGPRGSKEPWDDATVVRKELQHLLHKKNGRDEDPAHLE